MAARNTRRRANSLANVVPVRDTQVTQTVSRYDMSFPQNWTVEQLRSELTRNSVSFRKTDKKARLIQLCKDNGLISTRNSIPDGLTNSQQDVENSELTKLTNTVAELQNTVAMLSRNVDKLSQNNSVSTQNVSSNSAGSSVPIMSGTIQFPEVSCESPQPTLPSSTGGITDGQSMVAAASTGVSGMNLGAVTPTMGTQTRFGFSVESLPFIETVHPTLRKQIVEGKDINLAALLIPYYTGNHADSAEIIKDKDRPDPRLQNSLTLPQFIQAFGIYKNILCEVYPSRREELDLYERDIVDMASRYGGKGFYEYHRMFSAEAAAHLRYANRKVDWSVFGLGETWDGGDVAKTVGGGQKINLLREGLKDYKDRDDLIIMFTDSYDVVLTAGMTDILEKFHKFNARVVFSAEGFCWPDKTLADKYPEVKVNEKRFLCSGGFIGYAKDVYEIVTHKKIENRGDDQLYYTQIFLDTELREKWNIKLDKKSEIFMNLHGALGEIMLKYKGDHSYLYNVKTGTVPVVVHGNGPIKPEFNRLANYLADGWTQSSGCLSCNEDLVNLEGLQEEDFPTVLIGLFIEQPTPFLKSFFEKVVELDYPKQKIDLLIHNSADYHMSEVSTFVSSHGEKYKSVTVIKADDKVKESDARNWALEECVKRDCHYYFNIDGDAHLDNPNTLQLLIQQNRSVIAPLIGRPGKMWSNFWGALSQTGFYARSEDYMDIVEGNKIGLWNAPYISGSYLVQRHVVKAIKDAYTASDLDPDMAFCRLLREKSHFMYVNNQHHFGHLIDSENFETNHLHNDLYEIFNNPQDWEKKYLHQNYSSSLQDDAVTETPCPDVYWFPMVTETFCDHLVEEMEQYGQWSGGKSEDKRLPGGYENVPTDDIHLNQVGLDKMWLHVLDKYIMPLTTKVFWGYYSNPPRSLLNFVVKYHPDRQRLLRPHHDSSTFTTNIALNHPTEFEGGGCRFLRYNCSVLATRKGWMLMHPGRLTHFHEGLPVTKGTRYILVSFNDP